MALPIKTTIEDAQKVVAYLKTKPTGATVTDAKAAIDSRHLDPRKVRALETWGLIKAEGDRLTLTEDGRVLAREPERANEIYRRSIDRTRTYRAAVEWAFHQGFDVLDLNDTAAHWHAHHGDELGTTNETSIKDAVTCFFNLASGAGLGAYVLGRRGQATRLELNKSALRQFIEAGPSAPPVEPDNGDTGADPEEGLEGEEPGTPEVLQGSSAQSSEPDAVRVFIAHGKNTALVDQVETMLTLAGMESEVAEEEETAAIPVPDKVLGAMRRCTAGVICVDADAGQTKDGEFLINQNVLIEIGAAFVLYDKKVVLLWDKRLEVPSNLQGLYRCEYEGDEVSWAAGVKLMKAMATFRR
jgi:hypothetical protein